MINPKDTHGKRIAMIAWGEKSDGSDDVTVFTGIADWRDGHLTMVREPKESSFQIPDEWLDRLKPVEEKLREILLESEFCFSVSIGNLSDGEYLSTLQKTGLKWPSENGET
jgi:hypothetical protein